MSWFHSDAAIGQSVGGAYAILATPIRAILRSFNDANPRDKSNTRSSPARRHSHERTRRRPVEASAAFNSSHAQNHTYATSRKRQWKGSRSWEGSMIQVPPKKKLKLQHDGPSSPWLNEEWLRNSHKNVERTPSKQHTQSNGFNSRSDLMTRSRLGDSGTPVTDNSSYRRFGRSGSRFTQQRSSPSISLSKRSRPIHISNVSRSSSSDGIPNGRTHIVVGGYSVARRDTMPERAPVMQDILTDVSDEGRHNAPAKQSRYMPAAIQQPSPPPQPDHTLDETSSVKRDKENRRHDSYLYAEEFKGFSPSPSPEPERQRQRMPHAHGMSKPPTKSRGLVKTLFGKQADPVLNSPGAFPATSSEDSAEEYGNGDSSHESDSDVNDDSRKRFESPETSHRPHSRQHAERRRHSTTQSSYTMTPGFIHGAKAYFLEFMSPLRKQKTHVSTSVDMPDIGGLSIKKSRREKSDKWQNSKTSRQTREQKLKEEREAALAAGEYALVELSDEWDRRVRQAVRQGTPDGKYSPTDFARVVPHYASPPQRSKWLNDAVINDYVTLVAKHGNKDDRKDQVPTFAALSSFFFSKIEQDPTKAPASWTRRAKIAGKALLDCKMVFIPVNDGMHWTLCVIEPKDKRTITMYNSMGHSRNEHNIQAVYEWIQHHLGAAFIEGEWKINSRGVSPQQNNSDDCGVFTCTTARQLMLGQFEKTPYDHTIMAVQRKRMVAELVNGGLIKATAEV